MHNHTYFISSINDYHQAILLSQGPSSTYQSFFLTNDLKNNEG